MPEIAQLIESALANSPSQLLRRAAKHTVASMPGDTRLQELLDSDAGTAIRSLTLAEVRDALRESGIEPEAPSAASLAPSPEPAARRRVVSREESPEAVIFRNILDAVAAGPLTITQLAKVVDLEPTELRPYLDWMKSAGKLTATGRARATRYAAT